ncbi:MAG: RpiB/LacA/LacB family sugar-phosphate isomerase [Candidatus Micrarchaeales archaeon]|jgi:ribose 5-phosphate isomerase B
MTKEKIYVGSDHAGFKLKENIVEYLKEKSFEVKDDGPVSYDPEDDYPDYALKVCKDVLRHKAKGILICGTGQGMDRAANKVPGIYSSVAWNKESSTVAKKHGNVNVLCLAGRMTKPALAKKIVWTWLSVPFSGETKHMRRIAKIKQIENTYLKHR